MELYKDKYDIKHLVTWITWMQILNRFFSTDLRPSCSKISSRCSATVWAESACVACFDLGAGVQRLADTLQIGPCVLHSISTLIQVGFWTRPALFVSVRDAMTLFPSVLTGPVRHCCCCCCCCYCMNPDQHHSCSDVVTVSYLVRVNPWLCIWD